MATDSVIKMMVAVNMDYPTDSGCERKRKTQEKLVLVFFVFNCSIKGFLRRLNGASIVTLQQN